MNTKPVDRALYIAVCDELEGAQDEIETLKAKVRDQLIKFRVENIHHLDRVAELEAEKDRYTNSVMSNQLNKIKADAIHEAMMHATQIIDSDDSAENFHDTVCDYADKLKAGTL